MAVVEQNLWKLMDAFFKDVGLVRQHLDSYNVLIEGGLQEKINQFGTISIEVPELGFSIKFGKLEIGDPRVVEVDGSEHKILPLEARLRNLTYAAPMSLEMIEVRDDKEYSSEYIYVGDLPIMLKSKLCPLSDMSEEELISVGEDPADPGGYFIINGSERVMVALEDLIPNRILVDTDVSGSSIIYRAKVFSTTVGFRARIELRMKPDGCIYASLPGVPTELPVVILMRALGLKSDREIAEVVSLDESIQDLLDASFEKAVGVGDVDEAILYIGNRVAHGQIAEYRVRKAESILDKNFLPHLGRVSERRMDKTFYLGEMVARILELKLGRRKVDDKDHYANKRLKLAGPLLGDLFRVAFRNLCRDMKYQLERMSIRRHEPGLISAAIRPGIITDRVKHALATGNWGRGKVGITQLLDRTNFVATLSHLRRLQSPLSRSQPNFEARDLHSTHWGRLCPNETPEGSNCGLVKNLALMASISVNIDPEIVEALPSRFAIIPIGEADLELRRSGTKVFVDGRLVGFTEDPVRLVSGVREARRHGEISPELNIAYLTNEGENVPGMVYINCDAGRVRRPLIVVDGGEPRLSNEHLSKIISGELQWHDLISQGLCEYLDAEEEENAYVALAWDQITPEHTHVEVTSYCILGICGSLIPYAEHNQSPRNSYEAAMAKQALGIFSTNFFNRSDSRSHILYYPQLPLVYTKPMDIIGYKSRPTGQNCVVAVLSYEGYNMEDALIFNKSSVERGLARSNFFRIYEAECRQYLGGLKDRFEIPEVGTRGYRGEQYYGLLEEDGIINVEADVEGGSILIGRTSPPRFLEEYKEFEVKGPTRRDTSVGVRPSEVGTVDTIFIAQSVQGSKLVKVRVRDLRIPELGDKFASRHGQKGVIGMLVSQEDMPFTSDGLVPDIIINPHAIPSRMTIGHFVESVAGKAAALRGEPVDGTPFENESPEDLRSVLVDLGFQDSGKEVFYNGITGERFEANVFVGMIYYQKLHHMVADKMHARSRGQVQMLTRQPTEGRARGGGLRFGEMERDCLIGHGAAMLLKDRLLDESDKSLIYICENCGYIAYYDMKQRRYVCRLCADAAEISPVAMSYAFKLLLQELMSLCLTPKLQLRERA